MWNIPSKKRLAKIPKLHATEEIPLKEKKIFLHFFLSSCDWYIAEYDRNDLFFGHAILNMDVENAEWSYISFSELKAIGINGIEIDCELLEHWQTKPVSEISKIKI